MLPSKVGTGGRALGMSKTHSDIQFDHNGFAVLFARLEFV
jgi:hypothetical protein